MRQKYKVSGMHCASCSSIIERKLSKVDGVKSISVNYATEDAFIDHNEHANHELFNQILKPLGYSVASANSNHSGMNHDHAMTTDQTDALKLNVIISTPIVILSIFVMAWEIFGTYGYVPAMGYTIEEFFHHLLPVLATVMLFIVGQPYLKGFWNFIRYGQANMDTLIGIGTSAAYAYSFIVSAFEDSLKQYLDVNTMFYDVTIVVIGFITLGKYLETRSKAKTSDALKSLLSLQAKSALVRRDGNETEIPLDQVQPEDLVIVKPGGKVPVDGTVVEGSSHVDESMITGEPMPALRTVHDRVTGGTINQEGLLVIRATAVGRDSFLAHIVELVQAAQGSRAPIQKLADQISSVFVPVVLVIALLSLLGWLVIGSQYMPFDQALALGLNGFVGVLVIACPCALGLATPTAIIVGVGKGAQNGILVKNAESLEKLSKVKQIVLDKTGTITQGKPNVTLFKNISDLEDSRIISIAASLEKGSEHPLARALAAYAKDRNIESSPVAQFVSHQGKGVTATVNRIKYGIGSVSFAEALTGQATDAALIEEQTKQSQTPIVLFSQKRILAYFFVGDEIKKGVSDTLQMLQSKGITTHMATGDDDRAAQSIAKKVGIRSVRAKLMPEDKQVFVRELKQKGDLVAVAGDGVNDAPALAQADIAIAMATGTDVAIETSDITLIHGDINKLAQAISLSKKTLRTIKENLFWAFIFNIIGIPVAAGILYPFGIVLSPIIAGSAMAFSSVLVVANSLRLKTTKL